MIIICNNCNKKFEVDSNLIPDQGRLLQCASCMHKWFFKRAISKTNNDNYEVSFFDQNNTKKNKKTSPSDQLMKKIEAFSDEVQDEKIEFEKEEAIEKKIEININEEVSIKTKPKNQKNFKILNIVIVAIISFIAFIIIIDTFKYPIGKVLPGIEFILYNLYESIKDISLFIKDLT